MALVIQRFCVFHVLDTDSSFCLSKFHGKTSTSTQHEIPCSHLIATFFTRFGAQDFLFFQIQFTYVGFCNDILKLQLSLSHYFLLFENQKAKQKIKYWTQFELTYWIQNHQKCAQILPFRIIIKDASRFPSL